MIVRTGLNLAANTEEEAALQECQRVQLVHDRLHEVNQTEGVADLADVLENSRSAQYKLSNVVE